MNWLLIQLFTFFVALALLERTFFTVAAALLLHCMWVSTIYVTTEWRIIQALHSAPSFQLSLLWNSPSFYLISLLWNSPLSYLILSIMPLPSYQNYLTLILFQFGCYRTAPYLIFYILLLFGLVDIIIRFDSCLALLHTADSMPSHYFILLILKPYSYSAKLYSYSAISLYVLSFTLYLLIFLFSYLLISDLSDSRIISHWRISGL